MNKRRDVIILTCLAVCAFLVHLLCINRYGFFRDEFYYIACGEHLDFGYVDHPPLIALIAAGTRWLLGDALLAIRLPSAITATLIVLLTGILTREMGGKLFAQVLAAIAVMIAPVNLFIHHILSMNVYDHLFWVLAAICVAKIIKEPKPQYWIWLGIILGLGLQNKISMIFFIFGFGAGLLMTQQRRMLLTPWPCVSGLIAALMFLPHILWQIQHDFPTLEFMRHAQEFKNAALSPLAFFAQTALDIHPLAFLILLLGLFYCFFTSAGKNYRLLGWLFLSVLILLIAQRGKAYYLAAAFPIMLAAGSVALEGLLQGVRRRFWQPAILLLLLVTALPMVPLTLPILSPERLIKYIEALPFSISSGERHEMGPLPQHYADQFGWEEMVAKIADAYESLTPEEQAKCVIYADNYGEAGAVDFLGKKYGLPRAISRHNSYYLWGYGDADGSVVINVNDDEDFEELKEEFESVERLGSTYHPYAMPYENHLTIFICRKMRRPISEVWAAAHVYI